MQPPLYTSLSLPLRERMRKLRMLILDVDGVLTDGRLYFTATGDEIKAFSVLDGQGIKQLQRAGMPVAIITGRNSPLTARRAEDLGIRFLIQGREDKGVALSELCAELGLATADVAYMGDDLPDVSAMHLAGMAFTVPQAHYSAAALADYCTRAAGGAGAVREVCDLLLTARQEAREVNS